MTQPTDPDFFTPEEKLLLSLAAPGICAGLEHYGYPVNKTVAAMILITEYEALTVDFVEQGEEPEQFMKAIRKLQPQDEPVFRERLAKAFELPAGGMLRLLVATPRGVVTMKLILNGKAMPS
jgi:hypothetical protein